MVLNWDYATKRQLLQIALHEDCPVEYKYEAIKELQLKCWDSIFLQKLIKYWGLGYTASEIADLFGVEIWEVKKQLQKYNLFGKRVKKIRGLLD